MGQKKGKVPAHIQPKQFQHPGIDSSWVFILNQVEDPRDLSCNTRHSVKPFYLSFLLRSFAGQKTGKRCIT
jgi:hypothetical protein